MLERFLNRPLTMNRWRNIVIYCWVGILLNKAINGPFITQASPEGLTGFPGYAVLFLSLGFTCWMSNRENDWVDAIRRQEEAR